MVRPTLRSKQTATKQRLGKQTRPSDGKGCNDRSRSCPYDYSAAVDNYMYVRETECRCNTRLFCKIKSILIQHNIDNNRQLLLNDILIDSHGKRKREKGVLYDADYSVVKLVNCITFG